MTDFNIIPAVDLLDGRVVRLHQGKYDAVTVYGEDPAEFIGNFARAGAGLIHIVDLNAARNGDRSTNRVSVNRAIEAAGSARIEIGGGIRDDAALSEYLSRGVARCILGTSAVSDPEFLRRAIEAHGPERIVVGVDVRDGRVRVAGWERDGGVGVEEFIPFLEDAGVREIIFTDIRTDGAMTGPPLFELRSLLDSCSLRVIASGGISSVGDIETLLMLKREIETRTDARLVGAITGRAVYEGKLDVAEAVKTIREFNTAQP
jgi:phosphoribosylformimino-5-aminoimidazole carboxamide ribotide isomerase